MAKNVAQPPNLEAALQYAQLGYAVLPVWGLAGSRCTCAKGAQCPTPGKHPRALPAWTKRASTDPAQLAKLFPGDSTLNVGITPPEGHVILDIDPRNGGRETLEALLAGGALPATPIQRSGGGGVHLIFRGDPVGPLGKGIDIIRPRRGFVVAWPSNHVSGGKYEWRRAPWDCKVAALPAQLSGRGVVRSQDQAEDAPPLEEVQRALEVIPADDYDKWVMVGQALRHEYGAQGRELWLEWSRKSDKYKEGDETKWDTFDNNRTVKPVRAASILAVARECGYAPEFAKPSPRAAKRAHPPSIEVVRASELAAMDLPDVRVFVPGLIAAGLTVVAGRAKLGKSWMMLDLARCLSAGKPFLGQRTEQANVFYLALEDNKRRMKKRMTKLGVKEGDVAFGFTAARLDSGLVEQLNEAIERDGYEVIIIDTLAAIAPIAQGKKGVWAGDYDAVATLQREVAGRHNAAILVVTHTKKNADKGDAQDAIVNTTGILAGADAYWVFQRQSGGAGGEGRMVLTVRGRDIEEEEFALRFDRESTTWQMLGRAGQVVYSNAQKAILDVIDSNNKAMRWSDIKLASGLGSIFDASFARVVSRGLVEKDARGFYRRASLEHIIGTSR
jgi:hypothetical protein